MSTRQRGFTLIELVAIIVLLGIVGTAILGMFGQVGRSLVTNQDTQTGAQLAQACAEHIMTLRRSPTAGGYASILVGLDTNVCDASFAAFPPVAGFTAAPVVDVAQHTSATLLACPSVTAGSCKLVDIKVDNGGTQVATLTLMLVN